MRAVKKITTTLLLSLTVLVSGCTNDRHPPPAAGAYPQTVSPGKGGAIAGAVGGGIIGAATGTAGHIPLGMAGGAILLGAIASSSSITATEYLQQNGVNVVRLGDIVEIVIPADKIFLPNDTEIKYSGEPIMYAVVDVINQYGKVNVHVTAHTDNVGSENYKVNLSQLWAQSAATYLWAHGIPLKRIHFDGLADTHNIGSILTAQGSYYNRRVEIVFYVHHSNFT